MKTNLHRWDITYKGHCKWYYVNTEEKVIHIFADKHELNTETSLEYIFGYHTNHRSLVDKFKSNEYKVIVYKNNESNLYDEVLVNGSYYVDKGNNIHIEKELIEEI